MCILSRCVNVCIKILIFIRGKQKSTLSILAKRFLSKNVFYIRIFLPPPPRAGVEYLDKPTYTYIHRQNKTIPQSNLYPNIPSYIINIPDRRSTCRLFSYSIRMSCRILALLAQLVFLCFFEVLHLRIHSCKFLHVHTHTRALISNYPFLLL